MQAIIHTAGEKATSDTAQRCVRCAALMSRPGQTSFRPGARIANFGHGSWGTVKVSERSLPLNTEYRECRSRIAEAINA